MIKLLSALLLVTMLSCGENNPPLVSTDQDPPVEEIAPPEETVPPEETTETLPPEIPVTVVVVEPDQDAGTVEQPDAGKKEEKEKKCKKDHGRGRGKGHEKHEHCED